MEESTAIVTTTIITTVGIFCLRHRRLRLRRHRRHHLRRIITGTIGRRIPVGLSLLFANLRQTALFLLKCIL